MWAEGRVHTVSGPCFSPGSWMSELYRKGSVLGRGGSPEDTAEHRLRLGHGLDYCQVFQVFCSLHGPLINIHKCLCVFKMWRSGLPPASIGRGHDMAHVEWPSQLLWPEFLSHIKGGNWLEKGGREPELKTAECSKFSTSLPEENRGGLFSLFP